ncbi:MAG: hypothetical protein ABI054_12785, partial [Planctomycetota bacterium]
SIEPFKPEHFREYRDDRGKWVHSIGAFLTVYTALRTGDSMLAPTTAGPLPAGGAAPAANPSSGAPANNGGTNPGQSGANGANGASGGNNGAAGGDQGAGNAGGAAGAGQAGGGNSSGATAAGIAVNINTAPPCVLKALVDDREVPARWLDSVIEYRNLEEKKEDDAAAEEADPVYDEYGQVVIQRQVFDNLAELEQVAGVERLSGDGKAELLRLLTTQSQVFSIFVTARIVSPNDQSRFETQGPPRPGEREDELGNALTVTVRAVVWRVTSDDGTTIVPIVRWEVLDYMPMDVLDYPDEDR